MATRAPYDVKSRNRAMVIDDVQFVCNSSSDPAAANTVDGGGILSGAITRTGTGRIKLPIRGDWRRIRAFPEVIGTTGNQQIKVYAISTTDGSNYVELLTMTTLSDADLTSVTAYVTIHLEP